MYNWSFLFVVLHKPTLLPSTFNERGNRVINLNFYGMLQSMYVAKFIM